MSSYNPNEIKVGDKVQIPFHHSANMNGEKYVAYSSECIGAVAKLYKDYDWRGENNMASIYVIHDAESKGGQSYANYHSYKLEGLTVLERGDGRFELGVTHPFSERELAAQRLKAFMARIAAADTTYEGFVNAPTYVAHLYISQERKLLNELRSYVRKDGSINPDKVEKAFYRAGLTIDGWAREPILSVPEEFAHWSNRWRQGVDWKSLAIQLASDFKNI